MNTFTHARKSGEPSPRKKQLLRITGTVLALFAMTSCTAEQMASMDSLMSLAGQYGGAYIPSEARTAFAVAQKISAIAKYQASQKQLAEARAKAKPSTSGTRQYIRVKPDTSSSGSSGSSSQGTHVVTYDPATDKIDDEVLVVSESLSRGDSVSINGQSGKII